MRSTKLITIGNSPYKLHASADQTGYWSGYIAPTGETGLGTRGRVTTLDQAMTEARKAAEQHYAARQQARPRSPRSGLTPMPA